MNKFPERLSELRKEKNISQHNVAKNINVSQQTISSWEKGEREPDFDTLIILAQFFEVSTDYLLGVSEF